MSQLSEQPAGNAATSTQPGPVVVGIGDGGPDSYAVALEFAVQQARRLGRGLKLVHGCAPLTTLTALEPGISPAEAQYRSVRMLRLAAKTVVRRYGADIDVQRRATPGTGVAVLLDESAGASLVVLQRRVVSAVRRLHTGSTTSQVASKAACPVAVVRTGQPLRSAQAPVVVGVDASGHAQLAAQTALAEAALRRTSLTVVHAWQSHRLDYNMLDRETRRELRDRARRNLAEAMAGYRTDHPDIEVRLEIVDTLVVDALLDAARSAQLLVVGRHGTGHVGSIGLGGVARRCIGAADCPVIVTPSSRRPPRGPWLHPEPAA